MVYRLNKYCDVLLILQKIHVHINTTSMAG